MLSVYYKILIKLLLNCCGKPFNIKSEKKGKEKMGKHYVATLTPVSFI